MNLNVTIFVQFFNFFLAYRLLTSLLLKPLIAIMQKADMVNKELTEIIVQCDNKIAEINQKRLLNWHHFTVECQKNRPLMNPSYLLLDKNQQDFAIIVDDLQVKQNAQKMTRLVINCVSKELQHD